MQGLLEQPRSQFLGSNYGRGEYLKPPARVHLIEKKEKKKKEKAWRMIHRPGRWRVAEVYFYEDTTSRVREKILCAYM